MVKAYLRYEFSGAFGVITSSSNPVYDASGRLLLTSALENICVWNVKQGSLVRTLAPVVASSSNSSKAVAEVTCLARAPTGSQIAAGYSDGMVRLWDFESGECSVSLAGHKTAVTALRFHPSGSLLASGSKDTDIIVWDVAGETGLFRLRGHKDQVTDVVFVARGNRLLSCSKDGHVRVWDLDTQHCSQTVAGFKAEVWAMDVDPQERRLAVGSTDHELRVYAIRLPGDEEGEGEEGEPQAQAPAQAPQHRLLLPMGCVKRQSNERVAVVRYHGSGAYLLVQGAGKVVEVFKVRAEEEAKRKMKRRKKRRREKASKKASQPPQGQQAEAGSDDDDEGGQGDGEPGSGADADTLQASDELEPWHRSVLKHKARAVALSPPGARLRGGAVLQMAVSLSNNSLDVVDLDPEGGSNVAQQIQQAGHRSDVRAMALSADDSLLLSASNNLVKIWNPRTGSCLSSMESGYGLCALFAPGNRHAVVGTKEGTLEVFDLGAAERVAVEQAHGGAVWSLAALPDKTGFISGSADKQVKFWQWSVAVGEDGSRRLGLTCSRALTMADDVLCVRVSPDGRLLAVALLDSTIKVFYRDSLKFFLSLYGHKLPVLAMDISADSTLLVSGSADKNIKVWGLDFGDCHRSLFAHQDSVTAVSFVHNTHYVFTAGKDKALKYWDVDRCELLLELPGHHGELWALAVSTYGDFVVTGSHDRSLRRWERTNEPFFVEEEKEKRLESLFEEDAEAAADRAERTAVQQAGGADAEAGAARRTLDSVSAADAVIEALDMAAHEAQRWREYEEERVLNPKAKAPLPNPMMLGLKPAAYVLRALQQVRPNDMESALLLMPFTDALKLLGYLPAWLGQGAQVELASRVASLLLRLHHAQLVATPAARPVLLRLQRKLRPALHGLKDTLGFNVAALQHLQRLASERAGGAAVADPAAPLLGAKRALASH